jgi:hypothetical protein
VFGWVIPQNSIDFCKLVNFFRTVFHPEPSGRAIRFSSILSLYGSNLIRKVLRLYLQGYALFDSHDVM